MRKITLCLTLFGLFAIAVSAQPRIIEPKKDKTKTAVMAPTTFKVKYEGGMFGFNKKEEGTLKFDDANLRLVFFNKENKEIFGIPYTALVTIYPNTQSVQTTGGKVVQHVPIIGAGIVGQLMKSKQRYLVLNYEDRDMEVKGTTSFKLDSAELLASVVEALGNKAEMQQRGDSFYRPAKKRQKDDDDQ